MSNSLHNAYKDWNNATDSLPWGVQSVFHETLQAVSDGQIHLTYGADYSSGNPCLVNAAATMLGAIDGVGGTGVPSNNFSTLVSAFDNLNRELYSAGANTELGALSPLAADVLLKHFGTLKEKPVEDAVKEAVSNEAFANNIYNEPSDADMTRSWLNALEKDAVCDIDLSQLFHSEEDSHEGLPTNN